MATFQLGLEIMNQWKLSENYLIIAPNNNDKHMQSVN